MFDLTGKRALVTGASGGIGRAIAQKLADCGAEVALSGTRVEKLEEVASAISGKTHIVPCNLSDLEAVDKLIPNALRQWVAWTFWSTMLVSPAIISSCA